ncbi:MAG: DUF4446 family protein [Lachnospiraceae bacterium]
MASNVFSVLGLEMDPGILFIILFVLLITVFIVLFILLGKYSSLKKSYDKFMQGKKAKSLEEEISSVFNDINSLKAAAEKNKRDIKKIIENLRDTYQRVGIVKYDAFKEMGGKLSFSIALLNDNQTGFILNSVHSSDGCYVYTKEIIEGQCAISLGEEEKKALMLALQEETVDFN